MWAGSICWLWCCRQLCALLSNRLASTCTCCNGCCAAAHTPTTAYLPSSWLQLPCFVQPSGHGFLMVLSGVSSFT